MRPPRRGIGPSAPDLTDLEWAAIQPLLPKVRGVRRVDDRAIINGILWRLRTGRSWAAIPARYGRATTCHVRFIRWRDAGVWTRIMDAIARAHCGNIQLIHAAAAIVPPCYGMPPASANDPVAWIAASAA